jgi:phytoene synthase
MSQSVFSRLVGSSRYQAITDDALKDEDNAAWVMDLPSTVRDQWIQRIAWIRLIDRLAEEHFICTANRELAPTGRAGGSERGRSLQPTGSREFDQVYHDWQQLRAIALSPGPTRPARAAARLNLTHPIVIHIRDCWFQDPTDPLNQYSIQAWDQYLEAIATYHGSQLAIHTLADYRTMLERLAGAFFQILPFLRLDQCQAAGQFGVVDQFYNNLRDLAEDAQQGICYFPTEVLVHFGVRREAILDGSCCRQAGYQAMMRFWLEDYLPRLRRRAYRFILDDELHPSWQQLRSWSLHRYNRIEHLLRECKFDFVAFAPCYWEAVRQELSVSPHGELAAPSGAERIQAAHQTSRLALFLGMNASTLRMTQWLAGVLRPTTIPEQPDASHRPRLGGSWVSSMVS